MLPLSQHLLAARGWVTPVFLLQVFDNTDEGVTITLLDKALGVETDHCSAHRVAFVAADTESEPALVILADLNHDGRMG